MQLTEALTFISLICSVTAVTIKTTYISMRQERVLIFSFCMMSDYQSSSSRLCMKNVEILSDSLRLTCTDYTEVVNCVSGPDLSLFIISDWDIVKTKTKLWHSLLSVEDTRDSGFWKIKYLINKKIVKCI